MYTLSYSSIHESEIKLVGRRAFLLSLGARKVNGGLFFVLTGESFKKFLDFNSLESKIFDLFRTGIDESYFWDEIKSLFLNSKFPDDVLSEFRESYDALSVSKSDADNILRSFEARVNVILSSDFDSDFDGVFLNIRGFDNLVNAVKSCWFYSLKREGFSSLKKGIINFSFGVIVQKFLSADFSVEVLVDSDSLFVNSYKGLPEVSKGIFKDSHVLSFNNLEFLNYELNSQNFSILHQEESGVLLKKRLGRDGSDNKLSKQLISECCRLAKKVFSVVGSFIVVTFVIKKDVPFLFLVNVVKKDDFVASDFVGDKSLVEEDVDVSLNGVSVVDEVFVDKSYINKSSSSSDSFTEPVIDSSSVSVDSDSGFENSLSDDVVVDSDEFIIQESSAPVKSDDVFSLFSDSFKLLEDFILRKYKESFGFAPSSFEDAIYELDSKHGFVDKSKILKAFEVRSLLLNGESVDEDIIFVTLGVIEDFLKRNDL